MIKHQHHHYSKRNDVTIRADFYAYGGCTIKRLEHKIHIDRIPLTNYNAIVLAIGTNASEGVLNHMKTKYLSLINFIKSKYQSLTIICTTIIPRPRDHQRSHTKLQHFNHFIMRQLNAVHGLHVEVWDTRGGFLLKKKERRAARARCLDMSCMDGLHLSLWGKKMLRRHLQMCISHSSYYVT